MTFFSTFKPDLHYLDHSDYIQELDRRMKPGGCSQAGFNRADEDLLDVCQIDSSFLKNKGVTHEQIADRLEAILIKANFLLQQAYSRHTTLSSAKSYTAIVEDKWSVPAYLSTCGEQECPFSQDLNNSDTWCGRGKSSIQIINLSSGKSLNNITELHVHLIRDHHYFQGHSEYRLDPELAIEVLEIQPEVNYQLKTLSNYCWNAIIFEGEFDKKTLKAARKNKIDYFQSSAKEFEAFLLPYKDLDSYISGTLTPRQQIEKKGKKKNKTKEQIAQEIQSYMDFEAMLADCNSEAFVSSIDKQISQPDKKNYLHVFKHQSMSKIEKIYTIASATLSGDDLKNTSEFEVYEKIKSKTPVLQISDYVKIKLEQV